MMAADGVKVRRPRIAIAGASGFVGHALRERLQDRCDIIALTRSESGISDNRKDDDGVLWKRCDLFDPDDITRSLQDVDLLIYLVHSMSPQSRLTQARFDDLDLLLADNVRIATERAGVAHIAYLGGLGVADGSVQRSRHLDSRYEVGQVLADGPTRLTELRAGLVIGAGGSSFRMLIRLIRRLPFMALPRWTKTPTQPISVNDIIRAFELVVDDPDDWVGAYDLGIDEEMNYGEMIHRTARLIPRRIRSIPVPISSPRVSTLWIMLFSGEPYSLVSPLIASLKVPTVAAPNRLLDELKEGMTGFDVAIRQALDHAGSDQDPRRSTSRQDRSLISQRRLVRSVQRMTAPDDWAMSRVCTSYWKWFHSWSWMLFRTRLETDESGATRYVSIQLLGFITLLSLRRDDDRCTEESEMLSIVDGLLVRGGPGSKGEFEFRRVKRSGAVLTILQKFPPSLPWYIYLASQALAHKFVMAAFRGWLKRKRSGPRKEAG